MRWAQTTSIRPKFRSGSKCRGKKSQLIPGQEWTAKAGYKWGLLQFQPRDLGLASPSLYWKWHLLNKWWLNFQKFEAEICSHYWYVYLQQNWIPELEAQLKNPTGKENLLRSRNMQEEQLLWQEQALSWWILSKTPIYKGNCVREETLLKFTLRSAFKMVQGWKKRHPILAKIFIL